MMTTTVKTDPVRSDSISIDIDKVHNISQLEINNPFQWMDKITLYFPMVSFQQTVEKPRSFILSASGALITAIISIIICMYWSIWSFTSTNRYFMYSIIFTLAFIMKTLSRLIMLYYYYKTFSFPWYQLNISQTQPVISIVKSTKKRIIAFTICMFILFVAQIIRKSFELVTGKETVFEAILYLIEMYFVEIPNVFGQFTFSLILLNIRLSIDELIVICNELSVQQHDDDEMNIFVYALKKYKTLYHKLKEEYYPIWFWIVVLKLLAIILWFWIAITNYKQTMYDSPITGILWSLWNLIIVIEFIYSCNEVTSKYHKLKQIIWRIENKKNVFNDINEKLNYLFLRSYVINHRATVKLMKGGEVSITNATIFVVIFLFSMLVTYQVLE